MDGFLVPSAVMPHDLSLLGIRGRWETALPEGVDFPLYLDLGKPTKITARVAWQRHLPQGAVMAGLQFTKVSKRSQAALKGYLKGLQQSSRRSTPRVEDIIPIEILLDDADESFTTIASDLSRDGLQVTNDFALPEDKPIKVLLPLSMDAPLELSVTVRWQKKTAFGGVQAGLQFKDATEELGNIIDMYILALAEVRHNLDKELDAIHQG